MLPHEHRRFTEQLRERLESDPRVLALVALGSMSDEPPEPDQWSDHDFFVISRAREQERLRTDLSWLPDADQIAFAYRETAHGVKALYLSGHLLEFAVFDLDELGLARVDRFRTLFDHAGVEGRMRELRARTGREQRPDARWLSGQFLTALLVGVGRYLRGEHLSGRTVVQAAAGHLAQLLRDRQGAPDSIDPLRRFEKAFPQLGRELDAALARPPPAAAGLLLDIALRELRDLPAEAAGAVNARLPR